MATSLLISLPNRKTPLTMLPTPSPEPLIVHISGAVIQDGVIQLPPKSRVKDAIQAAGGLEIEADISQVNLASYIVDGQKIYIPFQSETNIPGTAFSKETHPENTLVISINKATQKELEKLPGIGEEKAKAILIERETRGKFLSLDELSTVPGISTKIIEQIRPFLVFE